jgi:dihydrofolate reductase
MIPVPDSASGSYEAPLSLIQRFEKAGEERILVVGGSEIATLFLREKLIDELWLTLEPKIFGEGGSFVTKEKLDIDLKLISCDRLNEKGTLVVKYKIR